MYAVWFGFEMLYRTKQISTPEGAFLFGMIPTNRQELREGAVLREQNALPCKIGIRINLMAKTDVDNVGAGRAAKGALPVDRTKQISTPVGAFLFGMIPTIFYFFYIYNISSLNITDLYIKYRKIENPRPLRNRKGRGFLYDSHIFFVKIIFVFCI